MPALLLAQPTTPLLLSLPASHVRSLAASLAGSARTAVLSRLPLEVSVTPNSKLPGTTQLNTLIGGLVTWVLLACVGAVLLGAAAWGIGSRSGYYGAQQNGRMMVLGGAVGAMVAGAASALVNFGFGLGSAVH
ncbi:MAG: hypothetical protein JWP39_19 [Jatrophihabitans sp.]|nr:hypothetical protein [Jatrophihabitans sp.]